MICRYEGNTYLFDHEVRGNQSGRPMAVGSWRVFVRTQLSLGKLIPKGSNTASQYS